MGNGILFWAIASWLATAVCGSNVGNFGDRGHITFSIMTGAWGVIAMIMSATLAEAFFRGTL